MALAIIGHLISITETVLSLKEFQGFLKLCARNQSQTANTFLLLLLCHNWFLAHASVVASSHAEVWDPVHAVWPPWGQAEGTSAARGRDGHTREPEEASDICEGRGPALAPRYPLPPHMSLARARHTVNTKPQVRSPPDP